MLFAGFSLWVVHQLVVTNTNVINSFIFPLGCVPRTHRLESVIENHALLIYHSLSNSKKNRNLQGVKGKIGSFCQIMAKFKLTSLFFLPSLL